MTKQELLRPLEKAIGYMVIATYDWRHEIRSLIEAHGGEVEAGDEEQKRLLKFLDILWNDYERMFEAALVQYRAAGRHDKYDDGKMLLECDRNSRSKLRALIRQQKRTVSREKIKDWVRKMWNETYWLHTEQCLCEILSELGYEISGEAKEKPIGRHRSSADGNS